LGSFCWN